MSDFRDGGSGNRGSGDDEGRRRDAIAIVGMGCRFPGGVRDRATLWRLLSEGVHASAELSARRARLQGWDSAQEAPRRGPFLEDVDLFDAGFFGISDGEARSMDPQQRLVLEVAWEALEDAGRPPDHLAGSATGVFLGIYGSDYAWLQSEMEGSGNLYSGLGAGHSIAANRLSYLLDFRGPSLAVDSTCSSSLVAVHLACRSLWAGESDLALAGGVSLILSDEVDRTVSRLVPVAADGRCKAFDAAADGIVRGEGCGLVVLARLGDALAAGDDVLAVIEGSAVNQDGRSNGFTAPNPDSQVDLMRRALADAGIAPSQLGMIEAHGTGTPLGDPIELAAIVDGLSKDPPDQPCAITSIKSNLGHTEAAAGVAGLMKAALCLHHGAIAPHLHFRRLNPQISLPPGLLEIPTALKPWPRGGGRRYAAASSFSIGGTNCQVVLGEAAEATAPGTRQPEAAGTGVLLLSARAPKALRRQAEAFLGLVASPGPALRDLCHSAALRRCHHRHRLAVVGASREALGTGLRGFLAGSPAPGVFTREAPDAPPEIVFVFSGQGAEWPGMAIDLLEGEPAFDRELSPFLGGFEALTGVAPRALLGEGRGDLLAQPLYALAATFLVQVGLAGVLAEWGVRPAAVVGHSGGEVAAAYVAGALSDGDALRVLFERGRVLQKLHGRGGMAAVELPAVDAAALVEGTGGRVSVAAINGARSCVLSGEPPALRELLLELHARGVRHRELAGRSAFHSAQVDGLDRELAAALREIRPQVARVPIVSTVTGEVSSRGDQVAAYWSTGLRRTVQFHRAMQRLAGEGFTQFVELGPHPVLCRHITELEEPAGLDALPSLRRGMPGRTALLRTAAALHCRGAQLDWSAVNPAGRLVPLPSYPWQRSSYWFSDGPVRRRLRQEVPVGEDGVTYEIEWQPTEPTEDAEAPLLAEPSVVAAQLAPRVKALAAETGLERYREMEPELEALCAAYAASCLAALGATELPVDPPGGPAAAFGVLPRHEPLFHRLVGLLEEDGLFERAAGRRVLAPAAVAPVDGADPSSTARRLQALREQYPGSRTELDLLGRCGPRLAEVLTGRLDPLDLLFPGGSTAEAEALYSETPFAATFNRLLAAAVASSLAGVDAARPLKVLEVGAGTGGTTRFVLPELAGRRVEYWFTDVSGAFLRRARTTHAEADFLEYRRLDIEADPVAQGVPAGHFDLVIAANVLHATSRLKRSLDHVRGVLKPGGLLLLLEVTAPQRLVDLTFGMTADWWTVGDEEIRRDHPLLDARSWADLLAESGFEEPRAAPSAEAEEADAFGASVILARKPRGAGAAGEPVAEAPDGGRWLLLADAGGTADAVAGELEARGERCLAARPEEGLLSDLLAGDGERWRGVVDLRPLDAPDLGSASAAAVQGAAEEACAGAVGVLRLLASAPGDAMPRLWLVTRGAQPVLSARPLPGGAQAPLWGLASVLESEHGELFGGIVDLDPGDRGADGSRLAGELLTSGRARQAAYRGSERYVPRLVRAEIAPPAAQGGVPVVADGTYLVTGGLGGMGLHVAAWLADKGATQLLLVGRRGLGGEGERPEAARRVEELRARGVSVTVSEVDACRDDQVAAMVREVEAGMPPLRGVVHAAGIFEDRVLLGQDRDLLARVLAPKVRGAWNLHLATLHLPLDFFVMFSSAAGLLGMAGLGNYAAANAFLDALAHHRQALGLPGLSIDWAGWTRVGMAAALGSRREAQWAAMGLDSLSPEEGLRLMERLMAAGRPQTAVISVDWSKFLAAFPDGRGPMLAAQLRETSPGAATGAASGDRTGELTARLAALDPARRGEALFEHVRDQVAALLELPASVSVDRERPLAESGLDSLLALELRNTLAVTTGLPLGVTLLFDHPSLDSLVGFLAGDLQVDWHGGGAARVEEDDLDALLGSLETLDEESVEGVLRGMATDLFSTSGPEGSES